MIVCVCKNINEDKIFNELEDGLNAANIIKKFECYQCNKCVSFIKQMYTDYNNAGVVERYTHKT